jgi:outer membrane protein assembly factor BamB
VDVELVEVRGAAPDLATFSTGSAAWSRATGTGRPDLGDPYDLEELVDRPPTPEDEHTAAQARTDRRRRWTVSAAGVCAAVLVWIALGVIVEARQEAARLETLAESPGILPPLTEPLAPAWTISGAWVSGEAGDLLLVGSSTAGSMRAVDARTGEVRWTYEPASDTADGSYCSALVEVEADGAPGPARERRDAPPGLLACTWTDYDVDGGGAGFGLSTVDIVSPADGRVLHTLDRKGTVLTLEVHGGDLVAAIASNEGYVQVDRWTMSTWARQWTYRSPEPLLGENLSSFRGFSTGNGVLQVEGQSVLSLSLETGREVDPAEQPVAPDLNVPLPDGGTAVWDYGTTGRGSGRVLDADGSVRFELSGPPLVVPVDDGTDPDVLFVDSGYHGVLAVDAATGRELWTSSMPNGYPIVQVDGVVVLGDWSSVNAVDVRDGSTLWTSEPDRRVGTDGLSDGDVVLLAGRERGHPYLGAHAIADGTELWRTPLPDGTTWVYATRAGVVVVGTDYSLTAMR